MYAGENFSDAQPGETDDFEFDFVNDVPAGVTVISAVWTCEAIIGSDPSAATRPVNPPVYNGNTRTLQRIAGLVAGVTYRLTAIATTSSGTIVELYSHVRCVAPA